MAKGAYVGVAGVARKVKSQFVGVAGVARKVKKAYAGVAGVSRLCWEGIQTVSVPTQSGTLTYNGSEQSPTWNGYDPNIMTIGGATSAIDAGTYITIFTLKDGYVWPNGTTETDTLWLIDSKDAQCTTSPSSTISRPISMAVGDTKEIDIKCTGCTVSDAVLSDSSMLKIISFDSTKIVVKALSAESGGGGGNLMAVNAISPFAVIPGTDQGNVYVTLRLKPDKNYKILQKIMYFKVIAK